MRFGIDEAGRGALAGPIVLACVGGLPPDAPWVAGLRDSKKLSANRRQRLAQQIFRGAAWVRTRAVGPETIDAQNVLVANQGGMERLADDVLEEHGFDAEVVVDGDVFPTHYAPGESKHTPSVTCLVRADASVQEVMAASIVAKHTRDTIMETFEDGRFSFHRHKGYGTAAHFRELKEHGPVEGWHRMSFNMHLPCESSGV